ncbi:MAG TPA: hypothetical protein VMB81_06050 [Candidatus Sulfotelmatobacter sp.]|nr:hypothetical protein [Candidatus Sulfotelmatobacter sp.]
MRTTDSITGTSICTPTTVASAAPDWKPDRQLEEIAGADQHRWRATQNSMPKRWFSRDRHGVS